MTYDLKAKLFRGFADPARLAILETLRQGPRCVSDLVEATGLLQPNLSMHLACLKECGLVRANRNGRFVVYELADHSAVQLLATAERLLSRVAARIEACPRYGRPKNKNNRRTTAR